MTDPKPFHDPTLPLKPALKVAVIRWLCKCGAWNWSHQKFCAECGEARP